MWCDYILNICPFLLLKNFLYKKWILVVWIIYQHFDDEPKNHKNLPYPMLQIVSGKSGSGKTYLAMKELLTPGFLDYKELYVLSPNINTIEYQF